MDTVLSAAASTTTATSAGRWDPERYGQRAGFVPAGGRELLGLLAPRPGERILDLGCGTGELTACLAAAGAAVEGVDASPRMIAAARAAHPGVAFTVGRGEDLVRHLPCDALFSNAALHWMPQAGRVAAALRGVLRHGGRLAVEFGGQGGVATLRAAIDRALAVVAPQRVGVWNAWYFPSAAQYAALLEEHGFRVARAELFPRPTPMADAPDGSGLRAWLALFAADLLGALGDAQREELIARAEAHARPRLWHDGVWTMDYVRVRVLATAV